MITGEPVPTAVDKALHRGAWAGLGAFLYSLLQWPWSLSWGVGASVLFHAVSLIALSLVYFAQKGEFRLDIAGTMGEAKEIEELDIPLDSTLDAADKAAPLEVFQFNQVTGDLPVMADAAETLKGAMDGQDDSDADSSKMLSGAIRVPSFAITKGSFTVWTDPKDPEPRKNYRIIIQVRLPESVKTYRLRDLSGDVRGTDGYYKKITFRSDERRGVKDGIVQIEIPIPGAAMLVKDVINIDSKILKESQTIDIVF